MRRVASAALIVLCGVFGLAARGTDAPELLARDLLRQLVEINTSPSGVGTTRAAEAVFARLVAAGFPAPDVQVLGPDARKGNLVARYRGVGSRRPLLLLAHLDVVEARRPDWSMDPFTFVEKDEHFYGRGTSDDKSMASILAADLIRLKREGFVPDRDIILALTADEEGGRANGMSWLLRTHRPLVDAELAINEGGSGEMRGGRNAVNEIQTSEKIYQDFRLSVRSAGGHSAKPVRENAIYRLADALGRLEDVEFPARLTETTRLYFERMAALQGDSRVAADMRAAAQPTPSLAAIERLSSVSPYFNALTHTTCVVTRIEGGHANNALPQSAAAYVNCRILPGEDPSAVRMRLEEAIADPAVVLTSIEDATPSPPSPLTPDILGAVESVTASLWPDVVVVPVMGVGASDAVYLRNAGIPTYGVEGLFRDVDDDRAHGRDERIGARQFYDALEFHYRLIKTLAGRPPGAIDSHGQGR